MARAKVDQKNRDRRRGMLVDASPAASRQIPSYPEVTSREHNI